MRAGRIAGFDGLRAVAVLMVFAHHASPGLRERMELGSHGVWLFFTLSGFLIVRILHAQRRSMEAGEAGFLEMLRRFHLRRSLRILPVYYLVLAAFSALSLLTTVRHFSDGAWIWYYTHTTNLYVGLVTGGWTGAFSHLWSLAIEQQFYLLASVALLLLPAARHLPVLAAFLLAALLVKLDLELVREAPAIRVYNSSIVNFAMIAWGGIMGLMAREQGFAAWKRASGLGMLFFAMPPLYALAGLEGWLVSQILSPFLAGLLLLHLFTRQESRLVRFLEAAPLLWLGTVSYGFYLYHNFLIGAADRASLPLPGLGIAAAFGATLAASWLSWHLVERPLLSLKNRSPAASRTPSVYPPPRANPG